MRFVALRFFTVYGPRQRPDLAIHKFARMMLEGLPIPLFGDGSTRRDYTFIDDIITGVRAAMAYDGSRYEVFNLGNNQTVTLNEMVDGLEQALGVRAVIERRRERPGDVPQTWASIDRARRLLSYEPSTSYPEGVRRFAEWLRGTWTQPGATTTFMSDR
jgi:UDP-glucuronate 4-epimerase